MVGAVCRTKKGKILNTYYSLNKCIVYSDKTEYTEFFSFKNIHFRGILK